MSESRSIPSLFPGPWRIEKTPSGYLIESANGKHVAYIYEEVEAFRREIVNHLTPAEALSMAKAIALLPELITKSEDKI